MLNLLELSVLLEIKHYKQVGKKNAPKPKDPDTLEKATNEI